MDLATGSWKYSVLAAEGIHESCIIFIPQDRWGETGCVEAKKREVSMWEKFEVVDSVEDTGQEPRIPTKWILTENETEQGEFKYLGLKTEKTEEGAYTQSQEDYIKGLEKIEVPVGSDRKELDEYRLLILRHGTGKLNWAAHGTRPELCYTVAELSTHFKKGDVGHLKQSINVSK